MSPGLGPERTRGRLSPSLGGLFRSSFCLRPLLRIAWMPGWVAAFVRHIDHGLNACDCTFPQLNDRLATGEALFESRTAGVGVAPKVIESPAALIWVLERRWMIVVDVAVSQVVHKPPRLVNYRLSLCD